jgi:transcriptional regulator with XRE-family HTH domain
MLADRAELSRINLSKLENGRAEAGIETLYRLASALGITLSELLEGI